MYYQDQTRETYVNLGGDLKTQSIESLITVRRVASQTAPNEEPGKIEVGQSPGSGEGYDMSLAPLESRPDVSPEYNFLWLVQLSAPDEL